MISNDLMRYSYVFGKAYLELNEHPQFDGLDIADKGTQPKLFPSAQARLDHVLAYLNQLEGTHGFIYENYCDEGTRNQAHPRMYFSASNAARIDAIREQIQDWQSDGRLTELEFYVLLASLLEAVPGVSNTSGTYAAFLKFWESRSQKTLTLVPPPLLQSCEKHEVHQGDAAVLARDLPSDVLYIDPPYNARQYAPNYHILETVACWDSPAIYGKSGMRPYADKKSAYCHKGTALQSLADLAAYSRCNLLLLSYNSEGIMPHDEIFGTLEKFGKLKVHEQPYRRYRSDKDHEKRQYKQETHVAERIYALICDR